MGFVKVVDKINTLFRALIIAAYMAATGVVGLSILCRNVFSISFPWSEEAAKYLVIFIVYCAAGLAARNGGLTRLTFLIDALHIKGKALRIVDCVVAPISIAFYVLVCYSTIMLMQMVHNSGQLTAALKIPAWIPYVSMVIGCVLLILNTIAHVLANGNENTEIEGGAAE